jgi:hypothetical protein
MVIIKRRNHNMTFWFCDPSNCLGALQSLLLDECPALGYSIFPCINKELTLLLMELMTFYAVSAAVRIIILI